MGGLLSLATKNGVKCVHGPDLTTTKQEMLTQSGYEIVWALSNIMYVYIT